MLVRAAGDGLQGALRGVESIDVAELAWRIVLGEQRRPDHLVARLHVVDGKRPLDVCGGIARRLLRAARQRRRQLLQAVAPGRVRHFGLWRRCAFGHDRRHAVVEHAGTVGQLQLDTPAPARHPATWRPGCARAARPASRGRRGAPGRAAARHESAASPRCGARPCPRAVRMSGCDADLVEQLVGRGAQQLGKPGVEGAHLDRRGRRRAPAAAGRRVRRRAARPARAARHGRAARAHAAAPSCPAMQRTAATGRAARASRRRPCA